MTAGDLVVLAALGLVVGAIIGDLRKSRKKGCCGSCEACKAGCRSCGEK